MGIVDDAKNFITEKVSNMPMPEASIKDMDLKGVGFNGITYLVKVSVYNPYGVSIPIGEITYKFKSAERDVATGSIPDPGSLSAKADTELEVTVKVPHSAIVSLVRDVAPDWDIDYVLEMGLIVDLPAIGNVTIPMSYQGELKLPSFLKGDSEPPSESAADTEKEKEKK
ncbi:desiccation-related protein PCC27-45-like [Andrographis paniculata]|uniref:desiccation-related protein PCC27-45-like n=1 Tax=Andrographis paniculata TaxID=175694 RepID=UPI0021E891BE|nr:desiccation-related protein PCC27-45-like [Andrographis paniculata]